MTPKNKKQIALLAVVALSLFSLAPLAKADPIVFTLSNSTLSGAPGATLTFQGSVSNNGAPTVFINGDSITASTGFLSVDDTAFFNNVPPSLAPNAGTGTVDLFNVFIDPSTPFGSYTFNFFNIVGGPDNMTQNLLATETFTVNVVPEPASALLVLTGGAILLRRHRKARASLQPKPSKAGGAGSAGP